MSARLVLKHLRLGVANRYPLCCVLAFTAVCATRREFPPRIFGGRRDRGGYVPCGVFHEPHEVWTGHEFVDADPVDGNRPLAALARAIDRIDGHRWPRLACWSYWPRPYDDVGDRRRWRWETRTPCQRGGIVCRVDSCPECGAAVLALASGAPVRCCDDHDPPGTVSR